MHEAYSRASLGQRLCVSAVPFHGGFGGAGAALDRKVSAGPA